ncbi:MAG: archaellin/type IV pilin N-terminal domain-containing protein, partial [Nanoarchaeota archaeon]
MKKRGVGPLIATIVLIAFLVVLSVLIFSFTRQFTFERIEGAEREKLEYEATIETAFDINFATISRDPNNLAFRVGVENTGRNDIIGFKVRSYGALGIEVTDIDADLTFFNKKTVLVIPFPNVGKIQSVELIPEIILDGEEFIVFDSRRETGVNDACALSEGGLCSDGIDNDCDGFIDQDDSDCQQAQCGNNICEPGEDPSNCPDDCQRQQCNNDGMCDRWEDSSCADCQQSVCNNNDQCEQGEDLDNCPNDCRSEPVCNNNGICELGESFGRCGDLDCEYKQDLDEPTQNWGFY